MKKGFKVTLIIAAGIVSIVLGIGIGSVFVPPADILKVFAHKLFGYEISDVSATAISIVWSLRSPRVLLAFLVGGALSVSGTVMQSVLKNPLASSYTIGVSSGASFGASLVLIFGITLPVAQYFALPLAGLLGGMITIFMVILFSSKVDKNMGSQTVILAGMVFSLFINAIQTMLITISRGGFEKLIMWQMGSFSLKEWPYVLIMCPVVLIGLLLLVRSSKDLDIMTFGEEQALAMGVELKKKKWELLWISSILTGCAVAFSGVIGFIDLVTPHLVRKLFGPSHRYVLPMSAILGGSFLVLADLVARTVITPNELPVGAVTALIGAPFFAMIYFRRGGRG